MNGINAPKQVECLGSDGEKYRQLAKSGNDDLRQDAVRKDDIYMSFYNFVVGFLLIIFVCLGKHNKIQVMEQFFGLVNMFLQNHRDTWKRRLGIRTYKVQIEFSRSLIIFL